MIGEWVPGDEGKRGRPKQLTRETIVEAAARFRQSELNLNNLAKALEVTPQSLYHYFPSIKAIDESVAEFVAESVPSPDPGLCWQDYFRQSLLLFREWVVLNKYPVVRGYQSPGLSAFRVGDRPSEALLRRFDAFLGVFIRDGFTPDQAITIWLWHQNFSRRSDVHAVEQSDLEDSFQDMKSDVRDFGEDRFSNLALVLDFECPAVDELYSGVVDRMIIGIENFYGVK